MHRIKRFYLLGAFVVALIIPLLTLTHYVVPVVTDFEITPLFSPIEPALTEVTTIEPSFWNLENVLWLVYGLGALLFAIRFIVNLINMYLRISKNDTLSKGAFIYVLLQEYRIPHSFFKYLFFNKAIYEAGNIPKEVQLHEETHAKQLHSLDILIIELVQIVFWFHPLVYILKHHIKLNHEFLADDAVLRQGIDTKAYQNTLLQFSSNTQEYHLTSAINFSSFKKRFTVMKTQTSKTRIWLSSLLLLPIIAILFYSFAAREYVEIDPISSPEISQNNNVQINEGASEAMIQEYRDFIAKLKDTNVIIGEKYERAKIIYDELMSEMQRNSVDKYPEHRFPLRSLSKVEAKKPTTSQFESWKNGDKYAIWIDSQPTENSELNNYNANDIVHFMGSKIYKNARSAAYPQPFQFNLYTQKGFQKTFKEADIANYKKLTERYAKAIGTYLKGAQTDNTELKILKVQADKLYQSFTKQELEKYTILPAPPVPAKKQQKATAEQIAAYNVWAKKINTAMAKAKATNDANWYPIIKLKDVNRYKAIYNAMTASQKQNAEVWPSFPPPPVRPSTPKKQEKATPKEISKYNSWAKLQNDKIKRINELPESDKLNGYLIINPKEYKPYHTIYTKMSVTQKLTSEPLPKGVLADKSMIQVTPDDAALNDIDDSKQDLKKQLDSRKVILKATETLNTAPIYTIDGQTVSLEKAYAYIKTNPKTFFTTSKNDDGSLTISFSSTAKKTMSDEALQKEYSTIFNAPNSRSTSSTLQFTPLKTKENSNPSFLDFIIDMETKGATFYIDDNGKYVVKLSSPKPTKKETTVLPIVNGKTIASGTIRLSLNEIKKLTLTLPHSEITGFKLKIPGIKTEQIKGNTITNTTLKNLTSAQTGDMVVLFDIKDTIDSKFAPLTITITDKTDVPSNKSIKNKEKGGPNANGDYYTLNDSDLKKEYSKKYKQYEALRYSKPHFIKKSKADKRVMNNLWVALRQMYFFKLSDTDKAGLKLPITPFAPYVRINKDGKSYYKVNRDLTDEERKGSTMFSIKRTSEFIGLDLLDDTDPIVIPIGTYELTKTLVKEDTTERGVLISISEDGKLDISKDNTFKNFETISIGTLESLLSKLTTDEIENTFVFAKAKDSKKFRSKPSASPEYQNDIKVTLIKDDIRFTVMEYNGKYREQPSYQLVLDNETSETLKSHVAKLAQLFKKYGITNLTI
tara:strand:+ start:98385 stop:101987 length:3603 start_codon:yes stop_codon:yes gene_type:complete